MRKGAHFVGSLPNRARLVRGALTLLVVIFGVGLIALLSGAVPVSMGDLVRGDRVARMIVVEVRLPRVIVAGLVGAALGLAGATFQTLLRNPLADPFILGVSGGAAAGAAVATSVGLARLTGFVPFAAFTGAVAAMLLVFALSKRNGLIDTTRLLLGGLVLNAFFSAVILLALSRTRGGDLTAALRWMMGTFFSATWSDVFVLVVVIVGGFAILVRRTGDLRSLAFGEDDARSRGVETERVKRTAYLTASLITGAAVSVSGIIGFVGLLVPHLVRLAWGSDARILLPLSLLGGAALVIGADTVSRVVMAPVELPVGALTALLGVPFFLSLLRGER